MDSIEEEAILTRFRNNYPAFPAGKVIHPDKPDFIIQGEINIGIEITQVFKDQDSPDGSFLKSKETFQRKLLSCICSFLNSSNFPKCIINIDLNDDKYSKKLNAKQIGELCYNDILIKLKGVTNKVIGTMKFKILELCPRLLTHVQYG